MTPQEQFLDMLANTRPIRGVAIREVAGGYNITGSTRYADKVTGGIQHEAHEEGIAIDARTAVGMAGNYIATGELQPVPTPMPLFANSLDPVAYLDATQAIAQAVI